MNPAKHTDLRRRELGKIHLAAKQLGMNEQTYREMLRSVAGVTSAADLDERGRHAVLDHLRAAGFRGAPARGCGYPGRPHNIGSEDRGSLLRKIEALLADAGRPWAYADGMARRMCRVERVAFCDPPQLGKLVAALMYDQKRRARST